MLAPAFESVLDPLAADHFPLLAVARDYWPELADSLPGGQDLIERAGALYLAEDDDDLRHRSGQLALFDPVSDILSAAAAQSLSPGLTTKGLALFTALDWRLDPRVMLGLLQAAFQAEGGTLRRSAVTDWSKSQAILSSGERHGADVLVLATGADTSLLSGLAECARLSPIKGQILRFDGAAPLAGPTVRAPDVYLAPSASGVMAGATMQAGRGDRDIEPEAVGRLRAAALGLFASLAGAPCSASAGVRAATPDGLPMVGFSASDSGLMLAIGARRNGWLLAPAMADVVAGRLRGLQPGAFGQAFDPARFAFR
jgi:glycine oxidase